MYRILKCGKSTTLPGNMLHLLILVPTLVHLIADSIRIIHHKKFVKHVNSSWLTFGVGVICGIIIVLTDTNVWWATIAAMLCAHFALFSISLNIVRIIYGSLPRKFLSITYLNSPSDGEQNWWDKLLEPIPPHGRLLMWLIIGMTAIAFEFYVDCVLHGINCP